MTAARSSGSFGKPNPTPEETCAEQYPEGCPPLIEATAQMNLIIKMVESVQKLLQETHDATVVQATKMVTVEKTLDLLNKSLSGMEVTGSSHGGDHVDLGDIDGKDQLAAQVGVRNGLGLKIVDWHSAIDTLLHDGDDLLRRVL